MGKNQRKIIGSRLKELRLEANLEQKDLIQLAKKRDDKFNMATSTYSSKETGARKIHLNEAELFSKILSNKLRRSFLEVYSYIFLTTKFTNSEYKK